MRMLFRAVPWVVVAMGTTSAEAQVRKEADFRWYIGPQIGVMSFVTPAQTRATVASAGGNILIVAKRTGLLLQVDQSFGGTQLSRYTDSLAAPPDGRVNVSFSSVRRYEGVLLGFLGRGYVEPYIGVGFGIAQAVSPRIAATQAPPITSPGALAIAEQNMSELGGFGYGTLLLGVQLRVGGVTAFGQGQITTSPSTKSGISPATFGRLLQDNMYNFNAGVRVTLGSARERVGAGGY
ncbi:MAG: hypothetical protein NW201_13225 [Gemmatimonadales bacterium]|nr:hypothetical protein [Gemmatimonadales bacterium]